MSEVTASTQCKTVFENIRENRVIYFGQLILAVLVGARGLGVGTDTAQYASWYEKIADCHCLWGNVEPGFNAFALLAAWINDSAFFFFFCISLTVFVMVNIISEKVASLDNQLELKNRQLISSLILLTFLLSPFFVSVHINAIRQGMAAFIVFYALLSFYDRSWVTFVVASLLAISIHTTSMMYLAFFPLLLLPYQGLLLLVGVLSLVYASGFSEVIVRYLSNLFEIPLHEYVVGYQSRVEYQAGVRYDFLIFSLAGLSFAIIGRYFSENKKVITALLKSYIVLLIPFLMLGYANFSNRYVYTAWLFLSVLTAYAAYAIPIWDKVRRFIHPYAIIAGQLIFLLMAINGFAK